MSPRLLARLSMGALLIGVGTSIYAGCVAAVLFNFHWRVILFGLPIAAAAGSINSWLFAKVSFASRRVPLQLLRFVTIANTILQLKLGVAAALGVIDNIGGDVFLRLFNVMMLVWACCVALICLRASLLASDVRNRFGAIPRDCWRCWARSFS